LTGKTIYQDPRCLLHPHAELCLRQASRLARQAGLRLRVLDAYRPPYAQYLLWAALPNAEYVRDPALGSHHSRGVAVDLTLVDEAGDALDLKSPTSSTRTCPPRCSAIACCCWASCWLPDSPI
jgi:D-alanyl-D-alanine dipeptidase